MPYYFQKEMIRLFDKDVIKYECERRNLHQLSPTLTPATIFSEISGGDLGEILPYKYTLDDGKEYYTHRYIRDEKYKLTTIDEIKRFLKWNLVDKEHYIADYYDCDNFSMQLAGDAQVWTPGLAFGIMDVPGHSINVCVTHDRKIWEIEPQSDVVKELRKETQIVMYLL